jgi:hypothetical protein
MSNRKSQTDSETYLMSTTNSLDESNDTFEKRDNNEREKSTLNTLLKDSQTGN